MTPIGSDYQRMFEEVVARLEAGELSDLDTALLRLDHAIDAKIRSALEPGDARAA